MSAVAVVDPDTKWYVDIRWANSLPDDATLVSAAFILPAALTEASNHVNTTDSIATLTGTGGTDGTDYECVCRVTYSRSTISVSDLTKDKTFTIRCRNQ